MKRYSPALLAIVTLTSAVCARGEVPKRIDVNKFPAAFVEDVVVPVPDEVFTVLNKLGTPHWKGLIRSGTASPPGDRPKTALLLGTVIADGFIAVQAEDKEEVKAIGRTVLSLAGAIGVRKSVISRSNSIIQAADESNWLRVRKELDGALTDVRQAMVELRDEELAHLVSLGGWLRGTEAVTTVIGQTYSPDGAELLNQPALLDYFSAKITGMDARMKENALVANIQARLGEMRPLIQEPSGKPPGPEQVNNLHRITEDLVRSITDRKI